MARTNYHQVKRQKETARKARQQEKLARKQARAGSAPGGEPVEPGPDAVPADSKETP